MLFKSPADFFFFSKLSFSKHSFDRNTIRVSNSLDSDQAQSIVGPHPGPIWLQRLSADKKSHSKQGKS